MIKETIELLGIKATDKVTGMKGIITSACFDLYGCIQVILTPYADEKNAVAEGRWLDVNRITLSKKRVMPVPDFENAGPVPQLYDKGASQKPAPRQ